MTLVSDATAKQEQLPPMSRMDKALPRINLKKRPIDEPLNLVSAMNLRSVNSAFLSGLFSDVAKVTTPLEESVEESPRKKTRLHRCGKSYTNIIPKSPSAAATDFFGPLSRSDSLQYQLSCVSDDKSDCDDTTKLAFPLLPSTVQDSSRSSTLTRKVSDLQMSVSEHSKESYGWFVEMEDGDSPFATTTTATTPNATTQGLAFCAATAPKAANYDAEVEWAQAADTVDDVLGDFF